MKLDLRDVTLCAVDSVNVALTTRALQRSMAQCDFADAILFTDAAISGAFRTEKISKIESTAEYSAFCFKELPGFVDTPFVLIVQWDGYVINPSAWSPAFRECDYVGSRWPWVTDGLSVGNGGFSLRSQKFLSAMMDPRFPLDLHSNSDWLVCRTYRPELESEYGVRFAPEGVADLFSHEKVVPTGPTFGFHSLENMWRYVDDAEMTEGIDLLSADVCRTEAYARLILAYFELGKLALLSALFRKMKRHLTRDEIWRTIKGNSDDEAWATNCLLLCERLSPFGPSEFLRRAYRKARRAIF